MPPRESLESDRGKPKRKRVRKSEWLGLQPNNRLTEDTVVTICRDLARGVSLKSCSAYLLISPDTLGLWRHRGEAYLENDCKPEADAIYGALVLGIRRALGKRDRKVEQQIMRKGSAHHFQFFRIAERLLPGVWGKDVPGGSDEVLNPDDRFL